MSEYLLDMLIDHDLDQMGQGLPARSDEDHVFMVQWDEIFSAALELMASAIRGVTSPIIAFGQVIETGPRIASASSALRTTGFSPVAPRLAPALII